MQMFSKGVKNICKACMRHPPVWARPRGLDGGDDVFVNTGAFGVRLFILLQCQVLENNPELLQKWCLFRNWDKGGVGAI